jgi:Flp pilus assembly protein TadD
MDQSTVSGEIEKPEESSQTDSNTTAGASPAESTNDFETCFKEGTRLLHQGKTSGAVPLLEKAHELQPQNADAAINLAGAYILTKKFRRARSILESLSEAEPDNPMVWINLGAAYLGNPVLAASEDQLRAIDAFKQALKLNPVAPHAAYNIGLIYRDRHENEEAKAWFAKAVQANPGDNDARSLLARLDAEDDS